MITMWLADKNGQIGRTTRNPVANRTLTKTTDAGNWARIIDTMDGNGAIRTNS